MSKIKDFIAIVRDGLLLCLFLLLIFFPVTFNKILERAGFTEGSFMGFTWKEKAIQSKQVADSSQQLAIKATQQVEEMQQHLDDISKKLTTLPASPAASEITQSIDSSKKQIKMYNVELKKNVLLQNNKLNNIFEPNQLKLIKADN